MGPVTAAAVHPGGHAAPVWLVLLLAAHLAEHRSAWMGRKVWVTSAQQPVPAPPDTTAIPHLLATRDPGGAVVDRVVWEAMPDTRSSDGSGGLCRRTGPGCTITCRTCWSCAAGCAATRQRTTVRSPP